MNCPHIEEGTCNRGCRGFQCRERDEQRSPAHGISLSPYSRQALQEGDRIAHGLTGVHRIPVAVLTVQEGEMPVVHLHPQVMQLPAGKYFLFRPDAATHLHQEKPNA